jgi:hypothetical protein
MEEPKKLTFFDFLNSINAGPRGTNLLGFCTASESDAAAPDSPSKQYLPFMVNRGLSFFHDSILYANAMNERPGLPAKMQFDFLRYGLRPRKRFSKWSKKASTSEAEKLIMAKYDYSEEKARYVLPLFPTSEIEKLKAERNVGGSKKA